MPEILPVFTFFLAFVTLVVSLLLLLKLTQSRETAELEARMRLLKEDIDRLERALREELSRTREESALLAKQEREELATSFGSLTDSVRSQMADIAMLQRNQLDMFRDLLVSRVGEMAMQQGNQFTAFSNQLATLVQANETRLDAMRETVEKRLKALQEENSQKLEQMRATVDEKLHATLEQRLGESFKIVSDRLELVHKGLGEMQTLATGVGDLKKVLMNVKVRGTWGEFQLGNLLEQILAPGQFERNVATKPGSSERVEYAIKLPGREHEIGKVVWLPIDAKFPQEDYQRLLDAQEQANPMLAEEAGRALENRIKLEARAIKEKYLDPPNTTDFGIMFLPVEGLYAEVLRRPGLGDLLQREYRVSVAGPTTLAALLNSLQMGFRTLAIEKRSSEVWALLGAVKTEFGRFGDILDKTHKKLQEASTSIETATVKSRSIERRLKGVQELPSSGSVDLLTPPNDRNNE